MISGFNYVNLRLYSQESGTFDVTDQLSAEKFKLIESNGKPIILELTLDEIMQVSALLDRVKLAGETTYGAKIDNTTFKLTMKNYRVSLIIDNF